MTCFGEEGVFKKNLLSIMIDIIYYREIKRVRN